MVSKTISVTQDVYNLLKREKFKGESFSDTIRRLVQTRGKISECAGLWADMGDDEIEEMKRAINELRESSKLSLEQRVADL